MNLRQLITTSTRHRSLGKSSGLTARILILCALAFTKLSAAPFTPGNLVIYRVGDAQVGVWSNTVEITVGG